MSPQNYHVLILKKYPIRMITQFFKYKHNLCVHELCVCKCVVLHEYFCVWHKYNQVKTLSIFFEYKPTEGMSGLLLIAVGAHLVP